MPERVLLLHGILRQEGSMRGMERALQHAGYATLNLTYPARKHGIPELVEQVHACTQGFLGGESPTHIITHSLGGLIARGLITRHRPPTLSRVVMLGPPNTGSELADLMGGVPGYDRLFGPAGRQLGTRQDPILLDMLGSITYDLGVIAGTRSLDPLGWALMPKPNDGKVSVARTRIDGMADHRVLPVTHTLMMKNPIVIRHTLHFLQHGCFLL